MIEDGGIEGGERGAQHPAGFGQRRIETRESLRIVAAAHVGKRVAGGEHILHRAVVQGFGEVAPLPILDPQRLGEQTRPVGGQRPDGGHPGAL